MSFSLDREDQAFSAGGVQSLIDGAGMTLVRLAADGAAIGPTIADVMGAGSAFAYQGGGIYLLEWFLMYLKSTAGTVTYTITSTNAPVNVIATYYQSPVGGSGAAGTSATAGVDGSALAATVLPATASLTDATEQHVIIRAVYEANAAAGNVRLRATSGAGTITPRRGSYLLVRRIAGGNVSGAFVA